MNEQYKTWEQLSNFNFPQGFKERLMKEQGWEKNFAQDAMDEYIKFIFLCKYAGHRVTPSETIDEVWHLHLVYSESYWEELCGKILNKKIHHLPGNGSEESEDVFKEQYIKTLDTYKKVFGTYNTTYWPIPSKKIETKELERVVESHSKKKGFFSRIFSKKRDNYVDTNSGTSNNITSSCGSSFLSYLDGDSSSESGHSSHNGDTGHGGGHSCSSHSCGHSCGSSCGSSCGGGGD